MLFNIFEKNAAIEPEKIAIIEDEGQITYSDLQKMIDTYVNLFTHEGAFKVDFGELVVMALPKSINQIAIILSLWKLGATVVPLNYNIGSDKLLSAASNLNAKFMIIESAIDFAQHESKKIFSVIMCLNIIEIKLSIRKLNYLLTYKLIFLSFVLNSPYFFISSFMLI